MGPIIRAIATTENNKIKAQLDSLFDSTEFDPSAASASRKKKCIDKSLNDAQTSSLDSSSIAMKVPKLDLMGEISKYCLKKMGTKEGKNSWKIRKSAMDEIDAALKKSNGLLSTENNHLSELASIVKALRERLSDSQSNLKPFAARLLGSLLAAVDSLSQGKLCKLAFSKLVFAALTDNRKPMRDTCLVSLKEGTNRLEIDGGGKNPASIEVVIFFLTPILKETQYKVTILATNI